MCRALDLMAQAVALKPDAYFFHGNLAEVYRASGDFVRAEESCRAAIRIWPDYPEALLGLGTALTALKRPEEAVVPLRRAVELQPSFVVAINNLGIALRELGQTQEALVQFRCAVDVEPSYAPAQYKSWRRPPILERKKKLSHRQEAVRLDGSSAEIHDNLGNVLECSTVSMRRGPPTGKRCGSTPSYRWPTLTSGSCSRRRATSPKPFPG